MGGLATGRTWIGKELSKEVFKSRETLPVVMVGTGYGNAVAALRLAERGFSVLMLEAGMDWEGFKLKNPDFKFPKITRPTKYSTWMRETSIAPIPLGNLGVNFKKFTGVLERRDFDHVKIYLGKGIGGGSLVNGGMTVTPDRAYLKEIYGKIGVEMPLDELFNEAFPLANRELGMNQIPDDLLNSEWYKFARMGVEEGIAAGFSPVSVPNLYDFDHMRKEILTQKERSATDIEVIYGNNYGKRDLTKTYLKQALATGKVSILPLHRVDTVEKLENGEYVLNISETDTQNQTLAKKELRTKHLFLGAGSLGTTEILLRSKKKNLLPKLTDEVGKYWANNGNTMASRYTWMVLGHESRGNNQSTMPVRGLSNMSDPSHRFFAEIAPMPVFGSHTAVYLVVNALKDFGSLAYNEFSDSIQPIWNNSHNAHMRENALFFLEKMNTHGSKGWGSNIYRNNTVLFPKNGVDEGICYHPLGGCVYGKATDEMGQLLEHDNLYITDGSLIPGSLGVNPYVTITAMAELCVGRILKSGRLNS